MLPDARPSVVGRRPWLRPLVWGLLIAGCAAAVAVGQSAARALAEGVPSSSDPAAVTSADGAVDEAASLEVPAATSPGSTPAATAPATKKKKPAKAKPAPWQVLHLPSHAQGQSLVALTDKSLIHPVTKLDLTGPDVGHPFLFGKFAINGRFAIVDGVLQRSEGLNAAIDLGEAEAFELEGLIDASGLGGWFLLCGWDEGSGYLIYNVNMKTSGCLWNVCELVRSTAVENTHHEFNRFEWKGTLPFSLRIADKQFQLRVGDAQLALDEPLENYQAGKLILGTYDTKYGPRNLKIQSLRMRSLSAGKK